jgi:hypothetical protein
VNLYELLNKTLNISGKPVPRVEAGTDLFNTINVIIKFSERISVLKWQI